MGSLYPWNQWICNQVIAVIEIHRPYAARLAPHRSNLIFVEPDGHAFVASQEDVILAVGDGGTQQFVTFIQRERNNAARKGIIKLR